MALFERQFFGRLRSADFACPQCGFLYKLLSSRRSDFWNPHLSRFFCARRCKKSYDLGLIAWDSVYGSGVGGKLSPPPDVISYVKLAPAHRPYTYNRVAGHRRRQEDAVNLVLPQEHPELTLGPEADGLARSHCREASPYTSHPPPGEAPTLKPLGVRREPGHPGPVKASEMPKLPKDQEEA